VHPVVGEGVPPGDGFCVEVQQIRRAAAWPEALADEADGALDKALSLFTDLYGQDANFRDVAAKVRELRGAVG